MQLRELLELDGVVNQNVNLATEKLTVEFEDDKVDYDQLEKAISKAGYKLIKEERKHKGGTGDEEDRWQTCAVEAVERVTKADGVKESNVNIATENAVISYDENKVSLDDINHAIIKAGYEPIERI